MYNRYISYGDISCYNKQTPYKASNTKEAYFFILHHPKWMFLVGSPPSSDSGTQDPLHLVLHHPQHMAPKVTCSSASRWWWGEKPWGSMSRRRYPRGQASNLCLSLTLTFYWLKRSHLASCNCKGCWEEGPNRCPGKSRTGFHHFAYPSLGCLCCGLFLARPEASGTSEIHVTQGSFPN